MLLTVNLMFAVCLGHGVRWWQQYLSGTMGDWM